MRGDDTSKGSLFSYIDLEKRVSADHPLRVIREIANAALSSAFASRQRALEAERSEQAQERAADGRPAHAAALRAIMRSPGR